MFLNQIQTLWYFPYLSNSIFHVEFSGGIQWTQPVLHEAYQELAGETRYCCQGQMRLSSHFSPLNRLSLKMSCWYNHSMVTPDHVLLDSAPKLGPLISRWEVKKFENFLIQKCQDFRGSEAFFSAIFEFVEFPTRYEWSNIRRPVQ